MNRFFYNLILFLAAVSFSNPRDAHAEGARPAENFSTLVNDGAWCWFADPRAIHFKGARDQTYVSWVNSGGVVAMAAYDHDRKTSETFSFRKVQVDDHANPALLVRPDRHLMIFYSAHNGPAMFYRISSKPEDITQWGEEMSLPRNSLFSTKVTYPNPYVLLAEKNRLFLFWRGGNLHPNFAWSDDLGTSWSEVRNLIESGEKFIYIKYVSNNRDTIHFAFTDTHPKFGERNSIHYACYRGGYIYGADGRQIKSLDELPMRTDQADLVYDAESGNARAWMWDIALDDKERPVIVYATFPDRKDHRYGYAKWDGVKWMANEITSAGAMITDGVREPFYSGGIAIDHDNPSNLIISREVDGIHELEKWRTSDGGVSWTSSTLTSGSSRKNVRPIIVRNHHPDMGVVWMHGDYPYYTEYRTELKFAPLPRE